MVQYSAKAALVEWSAEGDYVDRGMVMKEGAYVEPLPPAVQDQAAGLAVRLLAAIAEGQLVTEAGAAREDILVVFVQHGSEVLSPSSCWSS